MIGAFVQDKTWFHLVLSMIVDTEWVIEIGRTGEGSSDTLVQNVDLTHRVVTSIVGTSVVKQPQSASYVVIVATCYICSFKSIVIDCASSCGKIYKI